MDLRKLKKLIDLVQESGIAELEITEGEEKVRINRVGSPGHPGMMAIPPALAPVAAAPAAAALTAPAAGEAPAEPEGHVVKSPMVGTFYRSSAPGSKPFVEIGQNINAGNALHHRSDEVTERNRS